MLAAGYLQEACRCSAITHFHCESFTLSPLGGASTSGFVLLSRDVQFSREFYCTYVIEAPPHMRVSVRINHIRLPMLGASCKASVLRLYDGNSTQQASRQLIGQRRRDVLTHSRTRTKRQTDRQTDRQREREREFGIF